MLLGKLLPFIQSMSMLGASYHNLQLPGSNGLPGTVGPTKLRTRAAAEFTRDP